jgi:transcriptional regulator with PAS, ATPase and Fis domain
MIHANVYKHLNDELAMDALKSKRHVKGYLQTHIGDRKVYAEATPMLDDGEFCGIMVKYEEQTQADSQVVDITGLFEVDKKPAPVNPFPEIVTQDERFIRVLKQAKRAAQTTATIMVQGESGTGKELVARAIHKYSKRSTGPFVAVNCGAIPANLIESELFGFEAGAFTGATRQKKGKFELADGGTLFLDEIGDLPLELQVKLLRALQEREIERVGGTASIPVDVRIVTATHCHLKEMVYAGEFLEDLFYLLNVVPVELTELRERK